MSIKTTFKFYSVKDVPFIFIYKDGCYVAPPEKKKREKPAEREKGQRDYDANRHEILLCNEILGHNEMIEIVKNNLKQITGK